MTLDEEYGERNRGHAIHVTDDVPTRMPLRAAGRSSSFKLVLGLALGAVLGFAVTTTEMSLQWAGRNEATTAHDRGNLALAVHPHSGASRESEEVEAKRSPSEAPAIAKTESIVSDDQPQQKLPPPSLVPVSTDPPTNAPTEAPREPPTEPPAEPPSQQPTEPATLAPTEAPTEAPAVVTTAAPTEPPTDAPTVASTPVPTEAPTQPPTDAPTKQPTEPPTEPPTELPTSPPTPAPTEPPTAVPTELPTEPPTEAPTEPPTAAPTVAPTPPAEPSCSPETIDVHSIPLSSRTPRDRFYAMLDERGSFPPPVFKKSHMDLCASNGHTYRAWDYCLPITGRKDEPYCTGADRNDLLVPHTSGTRCHASILHLLLTDVYDAFQELGGKPALLYGTLLGAIRNSAVIAFTEAIDIGYQFREHELGTVKQYLWERGYHLFKENIYRVCIAPTHPLASNLYNPDKGHSACCNIPYVDLYRMSPESNGAMWRVEETNHGRRIPDSKLQPYTQVKINGAEFDTVADTTDFLLAEYGRDYMVPKPRRSIR